MANLQRHDPLSIVMSRQTAKNQRKVRIPFGLKKRSKKAKVEKVVEETVDPSCEIPSCGCGN